MTSIVNTIPSTVMLESYNSKLKKLLKYGNGDDVKWTVNGTAAGEVDVIISLPGGTTKTVQITRSDLKSKIPNDVDLDYVTIDVDSTNNVTDLVAIQNEILKVSNIGNADYDMIYSPEFAMSVLLWINKGIYVPPADMILTDVTPAAVEDTSELILIPDDGMKFEDDVAPVIVTKLTEVKMKPNSLAYVGSIKVAQKSNTNGGPAVMAEYDLAKHTNIGVPGQWEVNFDVSAAWREESAINDIANTILDIIGTKEDFQPAWNMVNATKDLEFNTPGKVSYIITPGSENPKYRLIGEFRLTVTQAAGGAKGWVPSVSNLNIDGLYGGNSGRRKATVSVNLSDEQLISQVQIAIATAYKNDISSGNKLSQDDLNSGILDLTDITINGDVIKVEPKPEYAFSHVGGLLLIELKRVDTPAELVTITDVFKKGSTTITYRVNPILTDEQITYNVILDILKPHMLQATKPITPSDLVHTLDGNVLTVTATPEAAGNIIDCNVVVTIERLVARDPIVNLNALFDYKMPEPDKTVENYDFKDVIESFLLEQTIAAGSDEIIDIESLKLSYEDRWNGGYISVPFPEMDSPIIGTVHFTYTGIRPIEPYTDLSSISNIGVPGKMIVNKSLAPRNPSYPTVNDFKKVLDVATEGFFDIDKITFDAAYSNKLLKLTPSPHSQPNSIIGELTVLYVTFDSNGNWVPTLNLSEITNGDDIGVWNITVPKEVTVDNYNVVTNAIKTKLQKIYSVNTDSLVGGFDNGVITLSVNPDVMVDAAGTLTIAATVDNSVTLPEDAFTFTSTTGDSTQEMLLTTFGANAPTNDWTVWMNGELVATSNGLVYNENMTTAISSNNSVLISMKTALFTNKTVTFAFDFASESATLHSEGHHSFGRRTTIDSFGGSINHHRLKMSCITTVPDVLPPHITNLTETISNLELFDQDLSGWDISNVTNLSYMFTNCPIFNQDISGWNTSNVTNMSVMFSGCYKFNQDISGWDTSNVASMHHMFQYASVFNQDLSGWNTRLINEIPQNFGVGTDAWTLPKPIWNTIDGEVID